MANHNNPRKFRNELHALFAGLLSLILLLAAGLASAQTTPPAEPKTSSPGELLQAEAGLNEPYLLGRGDVISIHIENRPEMNSRQTIGPDGFVSLPVVGSVKVVDLTREQAATAIANSLAPYYTSMTVTVSVDTYTSNKVLLLGSVERPGLQTFDAPPTLLEVLSRGGGMVRGGGVSSGVGGGESLRAGATGGLPDRCTIYRGSDTVLWVDVKQMLASGSSLADMRLKRDDVVYVPSQADRSISVLGQVQRPGLVALEQESTLARILSEAGGLTERAGKNPSVRVVQPSTGRSREIAFNDILKPGATDLTLHPGDVVYVPASGFNNAAYVIEKLSPLINIFTIASLLGH